MQTSHSLGDNLLFWDQIGHLWDLLRSTEKVFFYEEEEEGGGSYKGTCDLARVNKVLGPVADWS